MIRKLPRNIVGATFGKQNVVTDAPVTSKPTTSFTDFVFYARQGILGRGVTLFKRAFKVPTRRGQGNGGPK